MGANRGPEQEHDNSVAIDAFSRALGREAHVLVEHPKLLWQQLYNRLQWENAPVAALANAERKRRDDHGQAPWIHTRLPLRESRQLLQTLSGHTNYVSACAFSPDGMRIVTASDDQTLKVWEVASGRELLTLKGHTNMVLGCAFSPDGKWIASASKDRTLKIWDASNGLELRTLSGHQEGVNFCTFSPDSQWVISASWDNTLKLWDAASGNTVCTFNGHKGLVYACAFSPDGKQVVSASSDQTLILWDTTNGGKVRTLGGHSERVLGCAFSPGGSQIVSASMDTTLKVWDAANGQELRTLNGHKGYATGCAFSPDGSMIASCSSDNTIKLWDAAKGEELETLSGHTRRVLGVAFSPDGGMLASASMDATVKVWSAAYLRGQQLVTGHSMKVTACAISPDGKWFVSASEDRTIRAWDAADGKMLRIISNQAKDARACAISPDGSQVAATSGTVISLLDLNSGKEVLATQEGSVSDCTFSADGSRLFSAGEFALKIWETASGKELGALKGHTGWVNCCALSPDGKRVVSGSADKTLKIWDVASGQELHTLQGHTNSVASCSFSPDGTLVVSASFDQTIKLWDAASGVEVRTLSGHVKPVSDTAFSPDGAWIISACMDKTLRVWETISGEQRASIPLLGALNTIALHPTQPYAICGDDGGNLYLLDLFGLAYGPISVSATHDGMGYTLRCPACQREQPIQAEQLGSDMDCADETCGLSLHINQFYVEKEVQFGIAYLEKEYNELIVEWKGEKALETIEKILEVEPHNRKYQIEHVCLLLALRRMEDAEAALMHLKTIGIQPKGEDIGRIYFLKGAVTLRLKEQTQLIQKEALEALELSLQSMPISRTWFYRASILDILDNREAALKSYMEARRLEKEESTSQNPAVSHDTWKTGLYRFYFGENERDEIDVEIGWLYIKMNNFAKAKAELQAMIKRGVEDPMAVYGLGLALIGLKQFQEACPYFKRFLQIARQEHQSFISSAKDIIGKICTDVD